MENLNCALIYQAAPGTARGLALTQAIHAWDEEEPTFAILADVADAPAALEAIFAAGNLRRDLLPRLTRSISVGDVVALVPDEGTPSYYRCAPAGWTAVQAREAYDADHKAILFVTKG